MGKERLLDKAVKYNFAVVFIYTITGFLGLLLAVPPGYATTIWPPSGIALGFVLIYGLSCLPGIFIGSFILNFYVTYSIYGNITELVTIETGLITGTGAVLQALFGWWLIKVFVKLDNPLHLPKDILLSALLMGPVSCVVNSTFSNVGLYLNGIISADNFLTSWVTWWAGDSIGVLIFTPVILVAFAKPAHLWRCRFVPILIPLCLTFLIVIFAHIFHSQSELKRVESKFIELTNYKLNQLVGKLALTSEIGKGVALFFAMKPEINKSEFQSFGTKFLQENSIIQSIQWVPKITNPEEFKNKFHIEIISENSIPVDQLNLNGRVHYPVLFSAPENGSIFPGGYDLSVIFKADEVVQNSSKEQISAFPMILSHNGSIHKMFIVAPVYNKDEINGFILLQIDIVTLYKNTFNNFLKYSNITISNNSNEHDEKSRLEIYNNPLSVQSTKLFHTSLNYQFAGKTWYFSATSSPSFINQEYSWGVWQSLTTTLFFCVLMNIILFILYGQRYLIQYLAEARNLQLQTEKAKNKLLLNATGEGVLWIDLDCDIAFINSAAEKILEYTSDELKDESIYKILIEKIHKEAPPSIESLAVYRAIHEKTVVRIKEAVFWRKDHSYIWVEYTCIPIIIDNEVKGAAIIFSDITERLDNENKLMNMAHNDNLTKLPNRLSFFEFLEHAIARAHRNKNQFGVCFIDVDNFKHINDTFGHIYGDKLLMILSGKIKPYLRDADYFARIGGDEFGLVFEHTYRVNDLSKIIKRILAAFDKPILVDDQCIKASLSIGIAIYPVNGADSETLLKNADNAMYQSKAKGKSTFSFYNVTSNKKVLKYDQIESALHRAIKKNSFQIYYQPLINTITHKVLGVEALLRWEDVELKGIPLVESLLIAEDRGVMYELGRLILQQAFEEYQIISRKRSNLHLAVNISMKQIASPEFAELVRTLLNNHPIKSNQIYFEVKETLFKKNPDNIIDIMKDLHNFGIRFALDDFGIGSSSIHLLKKLPISFLKIDRSFIKNLDKNADDTTMVLTTIQLSHGLGISSIAEGVESKAQLELLKKWGCNIVQGFYFAKPMPLNELVSWMNTYDASLKNKPK